MHSRTLQLHAVPRSPLFCLFSMLDCRGGPLFLPCRTTVCGDGQILTSAPACRLEECMTAPAQVCNWPHLPVREPRSSGSYAVIASSKRGGCL
jgi:hypothetical protein